jgi:hypothetical protein
MMKQRLGYCRQHYCFIFKNPSALVQGQEILIYTIGFFMYKDKEQQCATKDKLVCDNRGSTIKRSFCPRAQFNGTLIEENN